MDRKDVLQLIFDHFQQVTQWAPSELEISAKYALKAEGLIELLEVEDCGFVGGFDPKHPLPDLCKWDLYDRFLCLLRNTKIKPTCGFTPKSMCDYFNKMYNLREKILDKK